MPSSALTSAYLERKFKCHIRGNARALRRGCMRRLKRQFLQGMKAARCSASLWLSGSVVKVCRLSAHLHLRERDIKVTKTDAKAQLPQVGGPANTLQSPCRCLNLSHAQHLKNNPTHTHSCTHTFPSLVLPRFWKSLTPKLTCNLIQSWGLITGPCSHFTSYCSHPKKWPNVGITIKTIKIPALKKGLL